MTPRDVLRTAGARLREGGAADRRPAETRQNRAPDRPVLLRTAARGLDRRRPPHRPGRLRRPRRHRPAGLRDGIRRRPPPATGRLVGYSLGGGVDWYGRRAGLVCTSCRIALVDRLTSKGTWPSRPRPWQAVAVAETAGGAGRVMRLRVERRGSCAFLHQVRVSRDEGPWTSRFVPSSSGAGIGRSSLVAVYGTSDERSGRPSGKGVGPMRTCDVLREPVTEAWSSSRTLDGSPENVPNPWTSLDLPHVPGVSWRSQPARAATRRPGRTSDGRTALNDVNPAAALPLHALRRLRG